MYNIIMKELEKEGMDHIEQGKKADIYAEIINAIQKAKTDKEGALIYINSLDIIETFETKSDSNILYSKYYSLYKNTEEDHIKRAYKELTYIAYTLASKLEQELNKIKGGK